MLKLSACPVEDDVRRWVEARMQWLANEFGADRLRTVKVVTPTTEFFPDRWDGTEEEVEALAERIAGYIGLDFGYIEMYPYDNPPAIMEGMSSGRAAGLYQEADGRFWVGYDATDLTNPLQLAATFAHEFAHIHLLGHRRITGDEPDHELLTDLCALALGMGVIVANAGVHEQNRRVGSVNWWSIGRQGYLDLRTFGYAHAVFAHIRREEIPIWAKHLRADVRSTMRKGSKWIEANGLTTMATPEHFVVPESLTGQVDWAVERQGEHNERWEERQSESPTCHYCGEREPPYVDRNDLPICKACWRSLQENEEEAVAAREQEDQHTQRIWPYVKTAFLVLLLTMAVIGALDSMWR